MIEPKDGEGKENDVPDLNVNQGISYIPLQFTAYFYHHTLV